MKFRTSVLLYFQLGQSSAHVINAVHYNIWIREYVVNIEYDTYSWFHRARFFWPAFGQNEGIWSSRTMQKKEIWGSWKMQKKECQCLGNGERSNVKVAEMENEIMSRLRKRRTKLPRSEAMSRSRIHIVIKKKNELIKTSTFILSNYNHNLKHCSLKRQD